MKATLEFDFDEGDCKYDFIRMIEAKATHLELSQLAEDLRAIYKYDKTDLGGEGFEDATKLAELIRNRLGEIMGV